MKHKSHIEATAQKRTAELERLNEQLLTEIAGLKKAGKEAGSLNAELERKLKERTSQLESAGKELEAFTYAVSHDLRAPLRIIDGFSQALLEDYPDKLDEDGRKFLNIIRSNTKRMDRLIGSLLVLSRAGRKELTLSDIDMKKLAKTVCDELKDASSDRTITVDIGELPSARGDIALLHQVFANLLSNSMKFTRTKEAAAIEVGGREEGDENIYYVRDNGVGLDMKYTDKLFGVFQRFHRLQEFEGAGIGLSIVRRIVHRHGGRVWAEAKRGEGATFYFTLPKRKDPKINKPEFSS